MLPPGGLNMKESYQEKHTQTEEDGGGGGGAGEEKRQSWASHTGRFYITTKLPQFRSSQSRAMVDHIRRCSSFNEIGVSGKYLFYVRSIIEHESDVFLAQ